ncbi:MAG: RraA family protein [Candidatus Hydrogenedentota bacterium]|nr:MAG: RraA family protein [Candidatus Hydrogenedentota bacterium]
MARNLSGEEVLELCDRMEQLYTAAVSDVLDELGMWSQVMEAGFAPIIPEAAAAGPAFTIAEEKAEQRVRLEEMDPSFLVGMLDAFCGTMEKGQIIVVSTNGFWGAGAYGELMATTAKYYGGVKGAVVDGPIRDVRRVVEIGFPVWAKGSIPTDSVGRAKLVGINENIVCGGVEVTPGDIVFADRDGVVVIPQAADLKLIVEKAEEVVHAERRSRDALRKGASLREVYERYGRL